MPQPHGGGGGTIGPAGALGMAAGGAAGGCGIEARRELSSAA